MSLRIEPRPSPNHSERKPGSVIDCIVLHADAGTSEGGTLSWITDKASGVSYHYLVGRTGKVYQCVETARKAWHAGISTFDGRRGCNDFSIGVSFANNNKGESYPPAQLDAAANLCAALMARYPDITIDRVTTHYVVAPERKTDPAPPFCLTTFRAMIEERLGYPPKLEMMP